MMKKFLFTIITLFSLGASAQTSLILHYDFMNDNGKVVQIGRAHV